MQLAGVPGSILPLLALRSRPSVLLGCLPTGRPNGVVSRGPAAVST